jgi:hypothetical protein
MAQWEYQVIRLNVEPPVATAPPVEPAAPPPAQGSAAGGAAAPQPAADKARHKAGFSEAYLREEFPRYYDSPPPQVQAQAQPEDPGSQLQGFLNGHGQQGWELVGFQHAAPHVFIVFKRPAGGSDSAQAALSAQQEQLRLTLDLANRALAIIEKQAG